MPGNYGRRIEALEGAIGAKCQRPCVKCVLATLGTDRQRDPKSACDGRPRSLGDVLASLPPSRVQQDGQR